MHFTFSRIIAALIVGVCGGANAADWVPASGQSCNAVCASVGQYAVSSGPYANGQLFYVCSANERGQGWRPGYNLSPGWAGRCMSEWGGGAAGSTNYRCLCDDANATVRAGGGTVGGTATGPAVGSGATGGSGLAVISATYGANCGAPAGNATAHVARQCNGSSSCNYIVDYKVIGDPVYGCAKDFRVDYRCGDGSTASAQVPPEAGYRKTAQLLCGSGGGGGATSRTFANPSVNGIAIDNCASFPHKCEGGGANSFCGLKGFRQASDWKYTSPGRTYLIEDRKVCEGGHCVGYSSVTCTR